MSRVAVIDYGSGNVRSMVNALAHVAGPEAVALSGDLDVLRRAPRLVLPGVGAFGSAIDKLKQTGLADLLRERVAAGVPVLGVCVGMQVFADCGFEHGRNAGLGLVPGTVERLPAGEHALKLPHVGFAPTAHRGHPVFAGLGDAPRFYYVHSFGFLPTQDEDVAATADYGSPVVAAVARGSLVGVQFHPEKSGETGLALLSSFLQFTP